MKRAFVYIFTILIIFTHTNIVIGSPSALPKEVISRLIIDYDKFDEKTFVLPRSFTSISLSEIAVYLGVSHNADYKHIFLSVVHFGDDWYFIERAVFLVNGVRYEPTATTEPDKEVFDNGKVYENLSHTGLLPSVKSLIRAVYDAGPDAVVEFKVYGGKSNPTGTLTPIQLQAWRDVFDYFNSVDLPEI